MEKLNVLLNTIEANFGTGCRAICEERLRQMDAKGYSQKDDAAKYTGQQLARAGAAYALRPVTLDYGRDFWPWKLETFKPTPKNRAGELAKAGALMAAQYDIELRQMPVPTEPADRLLRLTNTSCYYMEPGKVSMTLLQAKKLTKSEAEKLVEGFALQGFNFIIETTK